MEFTKILGGVDADSHSMLASGSNFLSSSAGLSSEQELRDLRERARNMLEKSIRRKGALEVENGVLQERVLQLEQAVAQEREERAQQKDLADEEIGELLRRQKQFEKQESKRKGAGTQTQLVGEDVRYFIERVEELEREAEAHRL